MNILVLCTGNSARSILLETILNTLSAGYVTAYSAGSKPAGQVHPDALSLLNEKGYLTEGLSSKSWDVFAEHDAPPMDLVVTVCGNAAGEECPMWPGAPLRAHWGVDDPAAVDDPVLRKQAFEKAYQALKSRAVAFLQLDLDAVGRDGLDPHLERIGQL